MTNDRIVTGVKTLGGKDPWAQGQSFRTVEQLQAQIASLTGENERLREACRLFVEYDDHNEGSAITLILLYNAAITATRAALQPKEGDQ